MSAVATAVLIGGPTGTGQVRQVDLPDGRSLEVRTAGPEDGAILLFHHGTPGTGLPFRMWTDAAAKRGLRLVMYSRPGYGASTPSPERRVIDATVDVARVVEALGASTFRTVGWSGGGPHALACAAALADQCLATATIAGVAPYPAVGLDWLAGMAAENVEEFGLAMQGREALRPFLQTFANAFATVSADDVAASLGGLVSEVDKAHLTSDFAEWMAELFRSGVAAGIEGWCEDDLAFVRDWGFDLRDCKSVVIWQGNQDRMVPDTHGRWLADHIPGARRRLLADQGHLSIALGAFDQILDDVLDPIRAP